MEEKRSLLEVRFASFLASTSTRLQKEKVHVDPLEIHHGAGVPGTHVRVDHFTSRSSAATGSSASEPSTVTSRLPHAGRTSAGADRIGTGPTGSRTTLTRSIQVPNQPPNAAQRPSSDTAEGARP